MLKLDIVQTVAFAGLILFLGYGLSGYVIWAYEMVKGKGPGRLPPAPPPAGA